MTASILIGRPERSEAADYYWTYIDQVPGGDIIATLDRQSNDVQSLCRDISNQRSLHRYAPGKWSIREVLSHVSDTERVFVFRALWFARGFSDPLPGFDQNIAVPAARADDRSWTAHVEDFRAVRAATLTLFRGLSADRWSCRGTASGVEFSVRALAFITAGHAAHHMRIVRERYL
jgi:hypothetical protein